MTLMATCGVENSQNFSLFGMPWEMHWAPLSFLKQNAVIIHIFVLSIALALFDFYVQGSDKVDSLRKALHTRESIRIPATMFPKTTKSCSKTIYAHCCILFE